MKLKSLTISTLIFISCFQAMAVDLTLWYHQPASKWVEALPLGNGKIGGMVFGGVEEDSIQLNEGSLWSGGPEKTNVNPQAITFLPQIRKALLEDQDYAKAEYIYYQITLLVNATSKPSCERIMFLPKQNKNIFSHTNLTLNYKTVEI